MYILSGNLKYINCLILAVYSLKIVEIYFEQRHCSITTTWYADKTHVYRYPYCIQHICTVKMYKHDFLKQFIMIVIIVIKICI